MRSLLAWTRRPATDGWVAVMISDEELRELAVEQDASKCPNDAAPLQETSLGGKVCGKCGYRESEEGVLTREIEVDTHNEYVPLLLELLEFRTKSKGGPST